MIRIKEGFLLERTGHYFRAGETVPDELMTDAERAEATKRGYLDKDIAQAKKVARGRSGASRKEA